MSDLLGATAASPLIAVVLGFAALLLVYFLFKGLVKLILILLIVALAVGGYFYFRETPNAKQDLKDAVESARTQTKKALEKGEEAAKKGQEALAKGRRLLERGRELLRKLIGRATDVWERGRETLGKVEKLFRGKEPGQ